MNSNAFETGTLEEVSFIEVASEIHRQKLTGSLYLTSGPPGRRAERVVYFSDGEVYAAASTLAIDSALAILIRAGRVTDETAARIQEEVAKGQNFSELLVHYRCVTPGELNKLRIEHVKSIFNSLCEWRGGSFRFKSEDQVPGGTLGVNTWEVLLEGALFARVPANFRDIADDPEITISTTEIKPPDDKLQPFSSFLVRSLEKPRKLVALMESAKANEDEEECLKQLFSLYCAGLISLDKGPAVSEEPLPQREPSVGADTVPLERALTRPAFEDPATAQRRRLEAIKKDIKHIRQLLTQAADDYEVLGLKAGAASQVVKHSYRRLVNHYHPDRHFTYSDTVTLATLSDILMAIRSAYESAIEHALLSEIISGNSMRRPVTKHKTDVVSINQNQAERIQEEETVEKSADLAAENYRKALALDSRGDTEGAVGLLQDAITLDPDSAKFHGALASLLEKLPSRREEAEQHFIRATELEPENVFYHLQLGGFYRGVGLLSRAEQQFLLALKIDPTDQAATLALDEISGMKKAAPPSYNRPVSVHKPNFWTRIFGRRNR